jgi:hypothetical protein
MKRYAIAAAGVLGLVGIAALEGDADACTCHTTCTHYPGAIYNASRGDLLFRYGDGDLVDQMLAAMHQTRTHVGMLTDGSTVRHNTRDMSGAANHLYNGNSAMDPVWLRHGQAGDGLQSSTPWGYAGSAATTVINTYGDPGHQANTSAAAAWLEQHSLEYRLHAYSEEQAAFTQTSWNDYSTGDMCSGTILEASQAAPGGFWRQYYDASTRASDAWAIFPQLESYINSKGSWGCGTPFTPSCPNGAAIAAQIVNCFAFDSCGAPDGCWQAYGSSCLGWYPDDFNTGWSANPNAYKYVGDGWSGNLEGWTVSPDDLVNWEIRYAGGGYTNYYPAENAASVSAPYNDCTQTCYGSGCGYNP